MLLPSKSTQNQLTGIAEGAFKSMFSLIPPFAIALGSWEGFQNARAIEFAEQLAEKVGRIEQDKLDRDYIESEEFYDLLKKCFKIRMQHRSKVKAKFLINLITESVCKDRNTRFSTSIKEIFLTLLDEMSDLEQIFLSDFANSKYAGKSRDDVYKEKNDVNTIALDTLYTKGILKDADTWEKPIEFSALGREFIEYITILSKQV